jgi:hypothetical protein
MAERFIKWVDPSNEVRIFQLHQEVSETQWKRIKPTLKQF